jgi:hypothetical protein
MYRLILATLITLFMVNTADARRVRQVQQPIQNTFIDFTGTSGFFFHTQQQASGRLREYGNVQMLAHPSGCPSRAFCGCGAAVAVFGTPRRDLWLAAAWLRFPRTSPASGMVAARRGHVFVLRQHIQGNVWMVEDYNSGGRKSRIHPRSISGYTIVNPRA